VIMFLIERENTSYGKEENQEENSKKIKT
jgi:hypothetical protein